MFFSTLATFSQVESEILINNNDSVKIIPHDSLRLLSADTVNNIIKTTKDTIISLSDTLNNNTSSKKGEKKKSKLDAPFDYSSKDSVIFNLDTREVLLYGEAEVVYESINLKAAMISINMNTKEIYAQGVTDSLGVETGRPIFKDGGDEFEADTIRYNLDTKKGIIKGVITEQGGGYLHGTKTKKLPDNSICIRNGKFTTCDRKHPHFYLNLSKARVIPNEKIITGPAYLVIEDIPVPIALPFGIFPDQGDHASGVIIPKYGEEDTRGFFLRDGGYYIHFNDYADTRILVDFFSNGSWGVKNRSQYKKRYKFDGNLQLDYSLMKIGEDFEESYSENETYWIKWNHRQNPKARPNSNFSANVNLGSSKFKTYNAMSYNDRMSGSTNSAVTYSLKLPNSPFSLNIAARHSQNRTSDETKEGRMDLTLPEMSFNMSRIYPFKKKKRVGKAKLYEKIGVTYRTNFKNIATQVHEDTLFTEQGLKEFRNGLKHTVPISTSMKLLKFFNFSPSFTYNERWYFKRINRDFFPEYINGEDTIIDHIIADTINGFSRSGDFLISLPISTKMYGMYQFIGKDPIIKAIRHTATPSISFSWRPDYSEDKYGYYQKYTKQDGTETNYSVFDGGNGAWKGIYGGPPQGEYGSIGLSLNNNLEMKARNRADSLGKGKKIPLLNSLAFSTAYNMALDSLNWAPLSIRANTSIINILRINFSTSMNFYDIDTLNRKINTFLYDSKGIIGRIDNWNVSIGVTLNSTGLSAGKNRKPITQTEEDLSRATGTPINAFYDYSDFSIPWNLNVDYSLIMNKKFDVSIQEFEEIITQTLRFSGNITLTDKWKFVYTSGYDMEKKELAYTSLNIVRDLHCWEMSLNLIPFGAYKSYTFSIHVKAAMLKDLDLPMRRNWVDNFDFNK